jgi:hypothetical protein
MTLDENSSVQEILPADSSFNEDEVLARLKRADLSAPELDNIAKQPAVSRSRKVKLALLEHPHTPRHVSLGLLRTLFTFDLMSVALMPVVNANIKIAAEESLIHRLEKLSIGEKMSLARRASGRVVAELLNEADHRVVDAALDSPRLTEDMVVKAVVHRDSTELLDKAVRSHSKWPMRPEIQQALQRRAERSTNGPRGEPK